jgi:hypothetical protein
MKKYDIDSNLPPPPRRGEWKLLVDRMRFGDSISFETDSEAQQLQMAIKKQNGAIGVKRKQQDGTYRVWKLQEL